MSLGKIGRYELLAKLATGGMGEVFLAKATGSSGFEKRVVIKRILPHLAGDPDFVRRFTDEGKLVVQLRHAGIAQVLDMGEDSGVTYIAMEYVDGRDIGELAHLARVGGVETTTPLIVTILCKLLEALDYAHHAVDQAGLPMGLIHRDISPSNVMISRAGEVKLLDFGIAKLAERLGGSTSGAIRGKYSYMSPQQAAGAPLDPRSDLFSVGVLAWELLAGERPFDGDNDLLTLDRIRFHDPGSLSAAAPDTPAAVVAVVDRLLAKEPAERFESADDAQRALQRYLQQEGALVSARDLAAWVGAILDTLPPGLRDRPGAGLSLDEALLLGLGSQPGGGPGPATAISAPASSPGDGGLGLDGFASASASSPAASALGVAPQPTTPGPAPRRRSAGFFVLLITLNLLLLAAVAWLVIRLSSEDEPPAAGPAVSVALARPASTPPALVDAHAAAPAPPEEPALDASTVALAEVGPSAEELDGGGSGSAPPLARADSLEPTAAARPGARLGATLARVAESALSAPVELLIRAVPAGAQITTLGLGGGASPRRLSLRPGTIVKGRAILQGYRPRSFSVVAGEVEGVSLRLEALAYGQVSFRFFPASAHALIDGQRVDIGGRNLVSKRLTVGSHRLVLLGADGARRAIPFEVRAGQTTNLKTLSLEPAASP